MKKIIAVVADGFEETELIATVDCLRRLNAGVTIAGLENSELNGAHNITLRAISWQIFGLPASLHYAATSIFTPCHGGASAETGPSASP